MRYVLKDLSIDFTNRSVRRGEVVLKLPDLSFDVLKKLIESAPESVNLASHSNVIWRNDYVSDETIAQRIRLLRKALGDDPKEPIYIRTVRGLGYALTETPKFVSEEVEKPSSAFRFKPRSLLFVSASVAVLALAVNLSQVFFQDDTSPKAETIVSDQPSEAEILLARAREQLSLHQAAETDRALAMLREARKLDPNNFDVRISLSFALSTKTTKFGGGHTEEKEAEELARSLIEEDPDSSNAWSALGYALGSQGRLDESLAAYQYAYQLNPYNASALSSAAHSYQVTGDLHRSLMLEVKAKEGGGTSRYAEIQIAHTLELIDHPASAEWYKRALALNPGQIVVLSEVARSHLRNGDPGAALRVLAEAKGADDNAFQIMELRGRAAIAQNDIVKAREYLDAAEKNGHLNIAALKALAGDVTAALATLNSDKLYDREGDTWPPTRVEFAELAAAVGDEERVFEFLTEAIDLGWRDIRWLKRSPFLFELMKTERGNEIEQRIIRELDLQRKLIEADEGLASLTKPNTNGV